MGAQRGGFGTYRILLGRVPLLQPSIRATAISGVALFFLGVNFGWSLDHWTGKSSWKSTDTAADPCSQDHSSDLRCHQCGHW